jgi:hypothetical protein
MWQRLRSGSVPHSHHPYNAIPDLWLGVRHTMVGFSQRDTQTQSDRRGIPSPESRTEAQAVFAALPRPHFDSRILARPTSAPPASPASDHPARRHCHPRRPGSPAPTWLPAKCPYVGDITCMLMRGVCGWPGKRLAKERRPGRGRALWPRQEDYAASKSRRRRAGRPAVGGGMRDPRPGRWVDRLPCRRPSFG